MVDTNGDSLLAQTEIDQLQALVLVDFGCRAFTVHQGISSENRVVGGVD